MKLSADTDDHAARASAGILMAAAVLAFALAWGGIELTRVTGRIAHIWLANSVLLAFFLKLPRREWWKIIIVGTVGNVLADSVVGDTAVETCVCSLANMSEILAIAWPVRVLKLDRNFSRPKCLLVFYSLAATVPAFVAALAAVYFHLAFALPLLTAAKNWYSADALGLVILTPMLLTLRMKALRQMFGREEIGGTAMLIAVVGFTVVLNYYLWDYPLAFLFFPAVMLLTFQRSFEGGAIGLLMTSVYLMVPVFVHGPSGSLRAHSLGDQVMIVQIFTAVISFSVVLFGAALEERKRLERGLASAITRAEISREEALVARDAAEKANRSKSMFLANMSHELRTPLNAVIGFAEMMRNEMFGPMGDARYSEYTGMIQGAGRHLLELINDILDMSKIEAGKFEIQREIFGLGGLVQDCVDMMRERAESSGISLSAEVPSHPVWAYADHKAIKQVLFNLLSNAIKFTPSGGKVLVRVTQADGMIVMSVSDTGVGIPAEQLPLLGNPFVQLRNNAGTSHAGTGLGLALVRSLVELHGGTFQLQSSEGEGTVVTVRIGAAKAAGLAA